MKLKSLKCGLAILLSVLMAVSSGASVYANENQPILMEDMRDSFESSEEKQSAESSEANEENQPAESFIPSEEVSLTESFISDEAGQPTEWTTLDEEWESTEVTETETQSTEPPVSSEEQEPLETELEEETGTETDATEVTETETELESTTEEFTETETVTELETETKTEIETELETETETETETEEEVVAFADIQDVVTFNTGNMAISVIPDEDYSDELFEACLEDNIYVVPFNEDGSFTIEAEADAFFPYEVQFQYDGATENKWFASPNDSVNVNGHPFCIHSEFSGEVVTQMKLSVADKTVTVYPEEKEFTNDGGVSTYSLMPLEEKELNVDLKGFNPLQLTMVSIDSIFAGENQISAEKIAWRLTWNDDYQIDSTGDQIDLSYNTGGTTTWEIIAGDADQLNLSNVRYRIIVATDNSVSWLKPTVCQQKSDGSFTGDLVKSHEYYDGFSFRVDAEWDKHVSRWESIDLENGVNESEALYLKFDSSIFGNDNVRVYAGTIQNLAEIAQETEITSDIFGGQGYRLPSDDRYYKYLTFTSFDSNGNITGLLPLYVTLRTANEYFCFKAYGKDNVSVSPFTQSSEHTEDNCELHVCSLYKGYPADQQYYLQAWHYLYGTGRTGSGAADGVTVYKGLYNTIEDARNSGAEDVTAAMFEKGYPDNYSEGVDFTFFTGDKVFRYNVKLVEGDRQPTLHNNFDFQVDGVNDANGNYIKSYGIRTTQDSYAEYNYLTVLVDDSVDLTSLALRFSVSNNAKVYCEDSSTPEESGTAVHDFSRGAVKYRVSAENGENATDYWIQVVNRDSANAKIYVNSLIDPDAKTETRDGVIYTTRKVMLDGTHSYVHDIIFANMGNADIANISVELDSEVLGLDPYWTLSGNQNLGTFHSEEINDDKTYGELSNLAKIRLKCKDGVPDGTDITGVLTVKEAGRNILVMNLTGTVGDPVITTTQMHAAVKYVPYEMKFQNENNYDKNTVTYSLQYDSDLPEGMELKPTGEFYGVPKETGTFHIIVRMESSVGDFSASVKEYDLVILDNTDENVENTIEAGYELSTKLSPIPSTSDYIVVSEGPYEEFRNVYIDGEQLKRGVDYEAESGSTRITIRSETLSKRGSGTHTLGIEFRKGGKDDGKLIRVAQNYKAEDIGVVQKPSGNENKENNDTGNSHTGNSTSNSTAVTSKPNYTETVPVQLGIKDDYIILQIDASRDGIVRADIFNKYVGQKVYLSVIFSADFGLMIDMFNVSYISQDIKISYVLLSDLAITPEFDVTHAIPNAIKPLGFEAIFNFHVGDQYIGKKAYIYVMNETGTGYDLAGAFVINEIGNLAFVFDKITDVIMFVDK